MFSLGKIEPGGTYMVVDARSNPRKPLHELADFSRRAKLVPVNGSALPADSVVISSALSVADIPLHLINTAKDLFQNRKKDYSLRSVENIVNAVKNETFRWENFDPIILWEEPTTLKYYILSGHSRTEAFKRLAETGTVYGGKSFDYIPAKISRVSLEEAKEIARKSNTLSTKETDTERAAYYREKRESGIPEKELREEAKTTEGKDANKILALSYLNPAGRIIAALESTDEADTTTKNTIGTVAAWIGSVRRSYPQLTDAHESELFEWLVYNGGYGTKSGQISNGDTFKDKVYTLIMRNTEFGEFNAEKPLNPKNLESKGPYELAYEEEMRAAEKALKEAVSIRDAKRREFVTRSKTDATVTQAIILKALEPYENAIILAQRAVIDLKKKAADVYAAEAAQPSLFGLGALEDKQFKEDLKAFFDGTFEGNRFNLGKASEVLKRCGFPDTFIYMGTATLREKLNKHPELTYDVLKGLPNKIAGPLAVFESKTVPGRKVILTEIETKIGKLIGAFALRGKEVKEVFAVSFHSRTDFNILGWINEGYLICAHKEKIHHFLRDSGYNCLKCKNALDLMTKVKKYLYSPNISPLGAVQVEIKTALSQNLTAHVAGCAKAVSDMVNMGIPIDTALSTVKKESGLAAQEWRKVVAVVQRQLQIFTKSDINLNGLGNPALMMAAKETAKVLGPIILEQGLKYAAEKAKQYADNKKQPAELGAVEVLAANKSQSFKADGRSYDGNPINYGGYKPTYRRLASYDHLIDAAANTHKYEGDQGLGFVLDKIKKIEKESRPQVVRLAAHLYADTEAQAAFNVWHWLKTNIGYSLEDHEQLRTPARSYKDRTWPKIDCDDYAIFAAALLSNMGYKPVFKVVAFNGKANFQHIYVIVGNHVVDPVLDYYGADPKNITNAMHVYTLQGVPAAAKKASRRTNAKAGLLRNLARAHANGDTKKIRVYRHILSRENRPEFLPLAGLSHLIADVQMEGFGAVGFVWTKPVEEFTEAEIERVHLAGDAYALGEVEACLNARDEAMEGLGRISKEERKKRIEARQTKRWAKQDKRIQKRQAKRIERVEKKNPDRAKKVKARIEKTNRRRNDLREANKGVSVARRVGRSFARFDPLAVTGRNSFLAVVKLNFRGLATNMSWGILSDDVLKKNGLSDTQIKNVRAAWEKLKKRWADLGGNPGALSDAIKSGYKKKPLFGQGKKGKAKGPKTLSGLGAALKLAARKNMLRGTVQELSGLGGLGGPQFAAIAAAAAAVIGALIPVITTVVKAAGKTDAGAGAAAVDPANVDDSTIEYPEGEAMPVTEDQMYEEAFPEDQEAEEYEEEAPADQEEEEYTEDTETDTETEY